MKKDSWQKNIPEIERKIGYVFKDKGLLTQAFTRSSYCNEEKSLALQSNEVLEFFGDGVLSVAIISFLLNGLTERYEHGIRTSLTEGDFSNIKSKLSDKKNLSECTLALGLQKYLRVGEGDIKLGISNEPSVMEDLFESIIGAVYVDCNMNLREVMRVVSGMLDIGKYTDKTPPIQSAKNALQEFCADKKIKLPQPRYETLSENGPDHKKVYERGVYLGERLVAKGVGKNQKLADTAAAEAALIILKKEYEELHQKEAAKPKQIAKKKVKIQSSAKDAPKTEGKSVKKTVQVKKNKATPSEQRKEKPTTAKPTAAGQKLLGKAKASPTYKDKGEQNGYAVIECTLLGVSATAKGKTRLEAREAALSLVKKQLKK